MKVNGIISDYDKREWYEAMLENDVGVDLKEVLPFVKHCPENLPNKENNE